MANINVNLVGFSPQVYDSWKNGAFSWHGGIKNGKPFINKGEVNVILEDDYQLKLNL